MKRRSAFVIMTLLLIASVLIAIRVGSVSVTLEDIVKAFTTGAKGTPGIVRDIRIPRVLMAVMVGANLAVSGVLLQGVMKNPMADPGITGISSGASVIVMVVMLYFPGRQPAFRCLVLSEESEHVSLYTHLHGRMDFPQ